MMKTIIITIALIFTVGILSATPQGPLAATSPDDVVLSEENYVNDIPFDTWMISMTSHPDSRMMMELPEEEYVDDIPFNTQLIAQKALLNEVMDENQESYVNDIPFNTEKVYNDVRLNSWTAKWRDESNVDDIPFSTCTLACHDFDSCCKNVWIDSDATIHLQGFRNMNNHEFIMDTERYLENLNERLREMDNLSLEYPF